MSFSSNHAEAREVFEEADRVLGFSLSALCFNGPEDDLKITENTQPAILTVSIAAYRVLQAKGLRPDCCCGTQPWRVFGAGCCRSTDSLPTPSRWCGGAAATCRKRSRQASAPWRRCSGIELPAVQSVCERAAQGQVVAPANLNSQTQIVIAGHQEAVERAVNLAKESGAKRAILLQVSAPFHCALLKPAEERLGPELDACAFADLQFPVVTNVDARPVDDGAAARDALKRQVSRPVRWQESVQWMLDEGVNTFVELGPGKVLSGLVRAADKVGAHVQCRRREIAGKCF